MLLRHVISFDMFRSNVFTASLLRVTFHATGGSTRSLRHHSAVCCFRLADGKAAALHRSTCVKLVASDRYVPRRTLFSLNTTGESMHKNRRVSTVTELGSVSRFKQARGASTIPEKPQGERAAGGESEAVSSGSSPQASDEKPSKAKQLRQVFKEYGAVGVSFHIGISLISLGIFYAAVSSGIDMTSVLCKLGFSESVVQSKMAAGTSTFVLAYAVHKLFAPVRISITLVSVPLIVRHLRRTGLFKPRTSAP